MGRKADTKKTARQVEASKPGRSKGTRRAKPSAQQGGNSKQRSARRTQRSFSELLRVEPDVDLASISTRATPGFRGSKRSASAKMAELAIEAAELQERLYANSRRGGRRRVLLVVQGMDTSGKGGIMRHVVGAVDPQGVQLTAFKAPTAVERSHPFLWRIRRALPAPGMIGVFDRSHYEDVLIVRVRELVPRALWSRRYAQIRAFEQSLVNDEVTVIKVMLHLSKDEQKVRLAARLAQPDKHWKFNPNDLVERAAWTQYQEAYQVALQRCSTQAAPWFVVPADRKWYARLAVLELLVEHLRALDLQWPTADFDVAQAQKDLAES